MDDEIIAWRRDLHANPELGYELPRTASFVADKRRAFGCEAGRVMGLRADMDALPIHQTSGLPYASTTESRMHACGHDGHTAMLLGAAKALAETLARWFEPEVRDTMHRWRRLSQRPSRQRAPPDRWLEKGRPYPSISPGARWRSRRAPAASMPGPGLPWMQSSSCRWSTANARQRAQRRR
jgi:hypothetical protein